ncbi:MAG: PAS domain S-box protein, partial [Methyloprofundus sp.]|nr:PAS domain S-box protein [Methyloprofundus sp.]
MTQINSVPIEQRIITKPIYGIFYLLVVVIFSSQAYLLFGYYGSKLEEVVIDTAGRQRMLSQRIAKNLLLVQLHNTDHEKEEQLEQVVLDLALLKQTELKLEKNNIFAAKELTHQLTNVVMHIQKMIMSHSADAEQLNALFNQYLQLEQLFVAVIDKIAVTQQKKITEAVQDYQAILWVSIAGTVLCFFMGVFFIVCPTINKVRASLGLLAASNVKQQHLIAELERKNSALKTAGDFAQQNERAMSAQAILVLQQKQFTDAILNSSHEAIISITSKGLINLFSTYAEKIFGYTADEVYLENVKILMPSPFKAAHDGYLSNYSNTGKKNIIGRGREVQGKKKDGTTFPLFLRVVEIKTETEHAFVGFIKDLSEIRRVEQQVRVNDRRYKAVVEDQTDLICRYTVGFVLTFANQAYCRYFGVRQEDIIGTSILSLLPEGIAAWFVETHAALSADSPMHIHEDKTLHNGKMEWHHWSTRAIFAEDGHSVIEFQGVGSIVTDRKLAELNAVLAKEAADKANMAKSQFLSSMSHELRTPLNSIIGFSQLMELDDSEPLSESQLDSVLQINNAGNHLLKLINEILDLSSIESGQITLINEDFDLVNVCADVLSIIKTLSTKKGVSITTDCESNKYWVNADYMRSKQVFLNILSNAIKYNHEQGSIHVGVTQQGQFVLINFTDTGVGIKEEALLELFKPFNRLGYESSAIEGTGIGLSLTKRLVEQMGGEIGVNSEFGEGSTFWVKLPVAKAAVVDAKVLQEQQAIFQEGFTAERICRLLYIEDNPANMELMRKIIKQLEGFTLFEAVDAEIGINMFEQVHPDIVLMDIDLPGMNGFDALLAIRASFPWAKNIPVIAVSSNAMAE